MRFPNLASAFALAVSIASAPQPVLADPVATAPNPAVAEVYSDLPRVARPNHYAISIAPDAKAMRFTGTVAIDLSVTAPTPAITLHAIDLTIVAARLVPAGNGPAIPLTVTTDAAAQKLRFEAPAMIARGTYRLEATYAGPIGTQATGLFALDYPDQSGKQARALFTQFEAADARRFAPMFDEPIYKATFDLSAIVPSGQMAIGNMPAASETDLGNGTKRVTFQTSPKMSSYLLFFATGDFDRITGRAANGTEVGVVTPKGLGEQGRLALDSTAQILPYYADYFGQPYPLPKLDNVAGPGQSQFFGAMENWGAIFSFQRGLLNDPKLTSPAQLGYIVTTVGHETAHQWFGDLVTMAWWSDLWLNEGFASWMETKSTDHFHPEWFALLGRVNGRERAMAQDAYRTTHPVVQDVRTVEEANQAFDGITYQKGEAVISMLEAYAGEGVWRDGIRAYMAAHKYGNSRTEDLWHAVEAAGAPGLTDIANDFAAQPGIPLVRFTGQSCKAGHTRLRLTQSEFTRDRVGQVSTRRWRVPLLVSAGDGEPAKAILQGGKATVDVAGCGPVLINAGQLGYYRSLYTLPQLASLARTLPHLKPIDQMGLVADQLELSNSGYQPMAPALDLLAAIPNTANPRVAELAVRNYATLYGTLAGMPGAQAKLAERAAAAWLPRLRQIGFEPRSGETQAEADLRATLIGSFGTMGNRDVVDSARSRFAALEGNPRAMDGELKTTWLQIAARNANAEQWDRIARLAATSTSAVEQADYYRLLGAAADDGLAQKALNLALTDAPGKTTSAAIVREVAQLHSELAFDFVQSHAAAIDALVDAGGRSRFLARLTDKARGPRMFAKITALAASLAPDARKPIDAILAKLTVAETARSRVAKETAAWLKAHPLR